ncbi:MAG: hypothetical protein FJX76_24210 [Armatimonadetes bacterium]|nr:hypothetical protein [Armatimonadota bacterium]
MEPGFCVRNIDDKGVRFRATIGVAALCAALFMTWPLYDVSIPHWWRTAVFPPLYVGVFALMQAREKT